MAIPPWKGILDPNGLKGKITILIDSRMFQNLLQTIQVQTEPNSTRTNIQQAGFPFLNPTNNLEKHSWTKLNRRHGRKLLIMSINSTQYPRDFAIQTDKREQPSQISLAADTSSMFGSGNNHCFNASSRRVPFLSQEPFSNPFSPFSVQRYPTKPLSPSGKTFFRSRQLPVRRILGKLSIRKRHFHPCTQKPFISAFIIGKPERKEPLEIAFFPKNRKIFFLPATIIYVVGIIWFAKNNSQKAFLRKLFSSTLNMPYFPANVKRKKGEDRNFS